MQRMPRWYNFASPLVQSGQSPLRSVRAGAMFRHPSAVVLPEAFPAPAGLGQASPVLWRLPPTDRKPGHATAQPGIEGLEWKASFWPARPLKYSSWSTAD